ncbi:hypothetical protein N7532_003833 [Penicillium argentinense]|uniref:Non-homologous end-joining factor 1 n=1 Tax=Penicillium argentinense TaxID=1131581 RepID=A0A9W9KEC6_9EURO|nr:uncharacterized protein N7532_003833 [Penicillium argentinense]KAJ5103304.1 hypothetical protein N7532_003833 [Penicillium argentinense]
MFPNWHRLKLSQSPRSIPALLFQYTWTHDGYELYLTDLTSIWSERLCVEDISNRAEQNATTIDPNEGSDQLDLLLRKIDEALGGNSSKPVIYSGSRTDSLELHISAKLPAPLRPLEWTLLLQKEPTEALVSHVLLPLIKDGAEWESRQRNLLDQIKQKDWILGKLFDRIESLGVEIGTIFPSAVGFRSARKGGTRSEAARFIKGVAPFDEQAWLSQSGTSSDGSNLASNIAHEIFGVETERDVEQNHQAQNEWWLELGKRSESSFHDENESALEEHAAPVQQRSNLQEHTERGQNDGETTATTDSEFERDERPFRKVAPKKRVSSSPKPTPKPSPKIASPPAPASKDGDATASESESNLDSAPGPRRTKIPSSSPSPKSDASTSGKPPPKKAMGRLGIIGGKKKKAEEKQYPPSSPEDPTPDTSSPARNDPAPSPAKTKMSSKLGVIGGKNKAKRKETSPPAPSTLSPDQQPPPKEEEPTPKKPIRESPINEKPTKPPTKAAPESAETEEEMAKRRREELKRQLEAQSKAPAKKKRRF